MPNLDSSNNLITAAYSNNMLLNSSTLLTPTSPHSFYVPMKSFQQNELQVQGQQEYCDTFAKTNQISPINCSNECFDWLDMCSTVDTPNSVQSVATPTTAIATTPATTNKYVKEEVFNFEPEYIEFFQQYCDYSKDDDTTKSFDTDYINYNESNCQSKSMCPSPTIDPWMSFNLNASNSPKATNVQQLALPPISTITDQFQSNFPDQEFNLIDSTTPIKSDYTMNNFNYNQIDEPKQNREDKNIWSLLNVDSNSSESPTDNMFANEIFKVEPEIGTSAPDEVKGVNNVPIKVEAVADVNSAEPINLICQWKDCFKSFANQGGLVEHIEKTHIEVKKGDEFSCHWLNCARHNKPFNARYKLLIHMRVHSGEKPNKCQVRMILCNYTNSISLRLVS